MTLLVLAGCTGGSAGDPGNRGPFEVSLISTGFGQVFPYRIRQADPNGFPGQVTLNIDDINVLKQNVTPNNGVLPVGTFETTATLPDGSPGNQFLQMMFSHRLQVESILDNSLAAQNNSGLTTAISVLQYDPATETTQVVPGRGFVGGYTYANRGGQLVLVQAVASSGTPNQLSVLEPEGQGFPNNFSGAEDLVSEKAFVFVADTDDSLSTLETFPTGQLIRIIVTSAVQDTDGKFLRHEVCTATTVGPDPNPPDVIGQISGAPLRIDPGNSMPNVDPTTVVRVEFNKPVQPGDMGTFFDPANLVPGPGGVTISVTAAAATFSVIYFADPASWSDMCSYVVTPAYNLPGQSTVNFTVNSTNVRGLTNLNLGSSSATDFSTGDGPGVVNAPVAPEVIYVGMSGPNPGLSVIDLNGFGQGTGDLNNTRFPLNPNIGQPNVDPALAPGTSNLDAGSAGVFTLTQDTLGNTLLLSDPLVGAIGDIHIGSPLDTIFNNFNVNRNSNTSNQTNPISFLNQAGNSIGIAPHPNPPPVRIIRAAKFAGRLGFALEQPTYEAMAEVAPDLSRAAPPRLLEEILRLLRGGHALESFQILRDIGALKVILPVIAEFLREAPEGDRVQFWRMLEALDHRVLSGADVPSPVMLGVLFAAPVRASALRENQRSWTTVAEHLIGPFAAELRLPRRDAGCLKRICGVQQRFTARGPKRFKTGSFLRDPYFGEALLLFELGCKATGEGLPELQRWQEL
ncbi:MAG: hypothetical protein L0Y54_21425, partial [Sporichthyaceae bacterium]|nr:hypothetical protein [Sporichthyaceae bacterium]